MRGVSILLLVCLLAAGCSGGQENGKGSDGDPSNLPSDGGTASSSPGGGAEAGSSQDLADGLAYEDQLVRYAVVADGDAFVELDATTVTPIAAFHDACSALSAYVDRPGNASSLLLVAWTSNANVYAEATVAGQRVPLAPDQFPDDSPGSGEVELAGGVRANLTAGERLVVELGGGGSSANANAPAFTANLTVRGDARLERLDPVPIACGTGVRRAEGSTAGLATYLVTTSTGGSLGFETRNASTMLVLSRDLTGQNEARLKFLDEPEQPLPPEAKLSSPKAGRSEILLDRWQDSGGSIAWFFADTHWPAYSSDK